MWKAQTKEAVLREIKIREWRRQVGRTFVRTLSWMLTSIFKSIVVALGWLKWQSAKLAHDIELNRLLSQRHDKLLRLGETVYAMYRSGEVSWDVVEPLCQDIEQIDRQIDATKAVSLQVLPQEPEQEQNLQTKSVASQ
ncbi:MAG: hypothetical protein RRA51_02015 [Armatimonadota bacterium]|jgi:hypothetical protein|nr:hypothetical protein [Armatimonadota bacterium]